MNFGSCFLFEDFRDVLLLLFKFCIVGDDFCIVGDDDVGEHITKVLQSNGYSKQFIDKTRRQWHLEQQNKNNNQPAEKEPEPVRRINLPYIQGLSEQF